MKKFFTLIKGFVIIKCFVIFTLVGSAIIKTSATAEVEIGDSPTETTLTTSITTSSDTLTDSDIKSIIDDIEKMLANEKPVGRQITDKKGKKIVTMSGLHEEKRSQEGILLTDVQEAINYLSDDTRRITKFKTIQSFMAEKNIRRDEAAAMFARARKLFISLEVPKILGECNFSDINDAHSDLKDIIDESCRMGLFKGSKGKFMPKTFITNAQALAVLIRMISGDEPEKGGTHRAQAYYMTAKYAGLTQGISANDMKKLDQPITRGDIAKLLEAAARYQEAKEILSSGNDEEIIFADGGFYTQPKRINRFE